MRQFHVRGHKTRSGALSVKVVLNTLHNERRSHGTTEVTRNMREIDARTLRGQVLGETSDKKVHEKQMWNEVRKKKKAICTELPDKAPQHWRVVAHCHLALFSGPKKKGSLTSRRVKKHGERPRRRKSKVAQLLQENGKEPKALHCSREEASRRQSPSATLKQQRGNRITCDRR